MADTDPAASILSVIRENNDRVIALCDMAPAVVRQLAEHDVPRLLAAAEEALKLADGATVLLSACGVSGRCSCREHPVAWNLNPAELRAIIAAALTPAPCPATTPRRTDS